MAKDKTSKGKKNADEKPAKGEKKVKAEKSAGGFAKPSEAPAGGDGWNFESKDGENLGKLFLITPLREEEHPDKFDKNGGTKKHIVADIVELDEKKPEKSELHEDVWVFGGYVRGALRGFIGEQKVLGRLQRDENNKKFKSTNEPWYLDDADDDDTQVALDYLASVDPFKQGGSADKVKKDKKKK